MLVSLTKTFFMKHFLLKLLLKLIPSRFLESDFLFRSLEKKGFHLVPNHFYFPVPDTSKIKPEIFTKKLDLTHLEIDEIGQKKLLEEFASQYKDEYSKFKINDPDNSSSFSINNGRFASVDVEILYCMVRKSKPANIIEIGSGISTLVIAEAISKNKIENSDYSCNLICIDPFPPDYLSDISDISQIVDKNVEDIPLSFFSVLQENDILFIDSSHTIKIYNDVCFEYLELVPSLNKGVVIHIHDILLPFVYSEEWLRSKLFWNEQFLLYSFLSFNKNFKILWAGNYVHTYFPELLHQAFPSYSFFKNNDQLKSQGHKSFWFKGIA